MLINLNMNLKICIYYHANFTISGSKPPDPMPGEATVVLPKTSPCRRVGSSGLVGPTLSYCFSDVVNALISTREKCVVYQ